MIPNIKDIPGIKKVLGSTSNIIWERETVIIPALLYDEGSSTHIELIAGSWPTGKWGYNHLQIFAPDWTTVAQQRPDKERFVINDLVPGSLYLFRIRAEYSTGEIGEWSEMLYAYTFAVPTELKVTNKTIRSLTLNWNWDDSHWTPERFKILRKISPETEWTEVGTSYGTQWIDNTVPHSSHCNYRLYAVIDTDGELSRSGEAQVNASSMVLTKPSAPTDLYAYNIFKSEFSVGFIAQWADNHVDELVTFYKVRYRYGAGFWNTETTTNRFLSIDSPENNTAMKATFGVTAINDAGESLESTAYTVYFPLNFPYVFNVDSITSNSARIYWNSVVGADNYVLERVEGPMEDSPNWETVSSGDNLSFTDTGLSSGTMYNYRLTAKDSTGTYLDSLSYSILATTLADDPIAPTDLQAVWMTGSGGYYSIYWDGGKNVEYYYIQHRLIGQTNWTTSTGSEYHGEGYWSAYGPSLPTGDYEFRLQAHGLNGTIVYSDIFTIN